MSFDIVRDTTDPKKEQEGVWMDYLGGSRVKIARLGNANFENIFNRKMAPYRKQERKGTLSTDIQTKIVCECASESILLDWEGFTKDGKPLKYSKLAAKELLEASVDFRNDMVELAGEQAAFHADYEEDSIKNS
jgi:hypothetical protein